MKTMYRINCSYIYKYCNGWTQSDTGWYGYDMEFIKNEIDKIKSRGGKILLISRLYRRKGHWQDKILFRNEKLICAYSKLEERIRVKNEELWQRRMIEIKNKKTKTH